MIAGRAGFRVPLSCKQCRDRSCQQPFFRTDQADKSIFQGIAAAFLAVILSAVPLAAIWPLAMIMMRSHKAATSCMMCVDKMTEWPAFFRSMNITPQGAGTHDIKPVTGFVQHHGLWFMDHGTGNGDLDPLSLGKAFGAPVDEITPCPVCPPVLQSAVPMSLRDIPCNSP